MRCVHVAAAGLSFAALMLCPRPLSAQEPTVKYDRFEDMTVVTTSPLGRRHHAGGSADFLVKAAFACDGDRLCKPDVVLLTFAAGNKYWKYRDNHDLIFALDNVTRIRLGTTEYVGNFEHGFAIENMAVAVAFDTFVQIVNAQVAEFKLGPTKSKLAPDQHDGLRRLYAKTQEPEP